MSDNCKHKQENRRRSATRPSKLLFRESRSRVTQRTIRTFPIHNQSGSRVPIFNTGGETSMIQFKQHMYGPSLNSSLKALFLIYLISFPYIFYYPFVQDASDTVRGYSDKRFQKVVEVFSSNFASGYEREGAALTIYHRGKQVVNIWGGYADRSAGRKWTANTITPVFSATKAIASLVIAVLVDRGVLKYEDRVVKYWPEYGANGKENTTIEDVLTHKAGIPYLKEQILIEDIQSGQILNKVASATPLWEPGTASGYHPVTFGLILDGILMNVDPKGRNVAQFFKEEIAEVHGIDAHIGFAGDHKRVAKVTTPMFWEFVRDMIKDPRIILMLGIIHGRPDDMVRKLTWSTPWFQADWNNVTLNDPSILSLPLSAVTGTTSASELARLFSMMLSSKLISNLTLSQIVEPTLNSWHLEQVTLWPVIKGHGFFYEPHPFISVSTIFISLQITAKEKNSQFFHKP
ncbi:hypothetical protein WR25_15686 isoform B [Diploscapter pachys]|uniref:Beta-lactamase-related domain-containing protein n=1 Tax=Diploscapter pachys TaxID=2018661 RepID=A0A2A2J3P6_9BILA|nr:hypothetical protein WR25_15686 isoform B [Diploscapter pachys]